MQQTRTCTSQIRNRLFDLLTLINRFIERCKTSERSSLFLAIAVEEAICPVATAEFGAFGETLLTDGHGVWAAWVETESSWGRDQAGNFTSYRERSFVLPIISQTLRVWRGREK